MMSLGTVSSTAAVDHPTGWAGEMEGWRRTLYRKLVIDIFEEHLFRDRRFILRLIVLLFRRDIARDRPGAACRASLLTVESSRA